MFDNLGFGNFKFRLPSGEVIKEITTIKKLSTGLETGILLKFYEILIELKLFEVYILINEEK